MNQTQTPQVKKVFNLQAPDLSDENKIGSVSHIRPYRKGGIRLQHEQIQGKHVFHNYGHGSTGPSLAHGSVFLSVKSISTYMKPGKYYDCAVLGSGLIALMTAVQLARNGHAPIVYAENFAHFEQKDLQKLLISQIDQGLVFPSGYDKSNKLLHELLTKMSYEYYLDCIKVHRYQSMKQVFLYERDMTIPQMKQIIPGFIYNNYKSVDVSVDNGQTHPYTRAKVVKIDTKLFIEELKTQAYLRNVQFVEKKFNTLDDVLGLKETLIFNCSGYSLNTLFKDENLIGKKSHFVVYKNPSKLKYTVGAQVNDKLHIRVDCCDDKITLRADSSVEQSNEQIVEKLIQQTKSFFTKREVAKKVQEVEKTVEA